MRKPLGQKNKTGREATNITIKLRGLSPGRMRFTLRRAPSRERIDADQASVLPKALGRRPFLSRYYVAWILVAMVAVVVLSCMLVFDAEQLFGDEGLGPFMLTWCLALATTWLVIETVEVLALAILTTALQLVEQWLANIHAEGELRFDGLEN